MVSANAGRTRFRFFGLLAIRQMVFGLMVVSVLGMISPVRIAPTHKGGLTAHADTPQNSERRIALLIGNSAYRNSPLANPVNDVRLMGKVLGEMGFDVTQKENLTQKEMIRSIQEFGQKLLQGGVGLFYFAGHGIQVNGENYLLPVDANIQREEQVEYEAVRAGRVLAEMEGAENRLNIVILDACRNNPLQRSFRSSVQGLAAMNAPTGTLVAYATAPGREALDGEEGKNGIYTQELVKNIQIPGLKIEDVFKRTRSSLQKMTGNRQVPWEHSSLTGDFYFNLSSASIALQPTPKQENQESGIEKVSDASPPVSSSGLPPVKKSENKKSTAREETQIASLPPAVPPKTPLKPELPPVPSDSHTKLTVFSLLLKGNPQNFKQRVMDTLNTVIREKKTFTLSFDSEKISQNKVWTRKSVFSSPEPDVGFICQAAEQLKADAVLVYSFSMKGMESSTPTLERAEVFLIDVRNKQKYSARRTMSYYISHPDGFSEVAKITREVLGQYEKASGEK